MAEKIVNPAGKPPLDPLKRVFVPLEFKGHFQTSDGAVYRRKPNGQIVRQSPKLHEFRRMVKRGKPRA